MRHSVGISVSDAIRSRRSHRHYLPDPIPTHTLDRVLELTLEAPSAWNYQGRSVVVVSDPEGRAGLLAAGVHEDRIIFVNFLASPQGLDAVGRARPQVRIVTSPIEERLNEQAFMIPGIGDFGDRFFGTVHAGPVR